VELDRERDPHDQEHGWDADAITHSWKAKRQRRNYIPLSG
jgi:hypothetical protein